MHCGVYMAELMEATLGCRILDPGAVRYPVTSRERLENAHLLLMLLERLLSGTELSHIEPEKVANGNPVHAVLVVVSLSSEL